jgi:hypothetical protein
VNRRAVAAVVGVIAVGAARADTPPQPATGDAVTITDDDASAHAPPRPRCYALVAAVALELAPLADDDVLERVAIAGARRWGRWQLGARLALAIGPRGMWVNEEAVEAGAWLRGSRRVDVLLAWRFGHAGFDFGYAKVHTMLFEPVAELAFHVSPAFDVRVDPFAIHLYRSGVWQVTFGPEVGVAWRL